MSGETPNLVDPRVDPSWRRMAQGKAETTVRARRVRPAIIPFNDEPIAGPARRPMPRFA